MELKLPLYIDAIEGAIPHRYPFLFIDRIIELDPGERIVGNKLITIADPILQGHFPNMPVFPGVLIVEGMAQISGVLGKYTLPEGFKDCLLTEISATRFRRPVVPGDVLTYEVKVEKKRPPFFWFHGEATVDGEMAAKASFSAVLR